MPVGDHPVVVTGTTGPSVTHVPVGPEAGLTGYPQSCVDVTDVHSVAHHDLLTLRGRLSVDGLQHVERCRRRFLGLL
ncbi:hypothetical protein AB2L27_07685 [Kineococcus sp. LSe6-4]|uniref:Type II toxin-antitoxin system PemK/MazF family toxin n=1 Tax=Kineococcus halophytocola TaxID=3234027 RepID=A0ABV4H0M1_9ACTN